MTPTSDLTARWQSSLMDTYGTPKLVLVRGSGATVWDADGRVYLDLLAGIAVNALGHAHPAVVAAVSKQVVTLGHVSNFAVTGPVVELAERLLGLTGRDGRVFFTNSGAEANEAAFKASRRTGRTHVVAAEGAFHGRTMGALALTGQPAKSDPFRPLPAGVTHVPYGDVPALAEAVDEKTAMVILEPVLGEGGVVPAPSGYLAAARRITSEHGALLCLDEVQTGIGRTGTMFAHEAAGVAPDLLTLAKGLGGGLPIGACIAFGAAADLLTPGSHGTTFGGNPVCAAAALAVLDVVVGADLPGRAKALGAWLVSEIEALGHPLVDGVRGVGLLLGIVLCQDRAPAVEEQLRLAGFLVNAVTPRVLRLAPPLVLTDVQADAFVAALPAALDAALAENGAP
ncbi:MAG: acetylornithine transaminase [Geodermatophilaceae bacterium]|nr:acetylornithine transaminase [Geodermatophilaceae bacterium]